MIEHSYILDVLFVLYYEALILRWLLAHHLLNQFVVVPYCLAYVVVIILLSVPHLPRENARLRLEEVADQLPI